MYIVVDGYPEESLCACAWLVICHAGPPNLGGLGLQDLCSGAPGLVLKHLYGGSKQVAKE